MKLPIAILNPIRTIITRLPFSKNKIMLFRWFINEDETPSSIRPSVLSIDRNGFVESLIVQNLHTYSGELPQFIRRDKVPQIQQAEQLRNGNSLSIQAKWS